MLRGATVRAVRGWMERRIGSTKTEFVLGFAATILMGLALGYSFPRLGMPLESSQTHDSLAQIAATLLIAYSIEMGVVVRDSTNLRRRGEDERDTWVGFAVGIGAAGLVAVFAAISCAQHATTSTSFSTIWELLAGVAVGGTVMIGVLVVALPVLWMERMKQPRT